MKANMIRSSDYGETWEEVEREDISRTTHLTNFVGGKIATVDRMTSNSTFPYVIQISNNFGSTWSTIYIDEPIRSVYFLNDNLGYLGGLSKVYKTLDGGLTWIEVLNIKAVAIFNNISFSDENNGIAYTYYQIYVTPDGGQTWEVEYCKNSRRIEYIHAFQESSISLFGKYLYVRNPMPDFNCDDINSISKDLGLDIKLAPNPSTNYFYLIGNTKGNYQIEIRNIDGILQKSQTVSIQEEVNISDLATGIYFVRIYRNGESKTFKFAKY